MNPPARSHKGVRRLRPEQAQDASLAVATPALAETQDFDAEMEALGVRPWVDDVDLSLPHAAAQAEPPPRASGRNASPEMEQIKQTTDSTQGIDAENKLHVGTGSAAPAPEFPDPEFPDPEDLRLSEDRGALEDWGPSENPRPPEDPNCPEEIVGPEDPAQAEQLFLQLMSTPWEVQENPPPTMDLPTMVPRKPASRRRTLGRGKRARPQATLDLHGQTRKEALLALAEFIEQRRSLEAQEVLVITGSGLHSGERGPVLRGAIADWLQHSSSVARYAPAPQRWGGSGAFWIELRRRDPS